MPPILLAAPVVALDSVVVVSSETEFTNPMILEYAFVVLAASFNSSSFEVSSALYAYYVEWVMLLYTVTSFVVSSYTP